MQACKVVYGYTPGLLNIHPIGDSVNRSADSFVGLRYHVDVMSVAPYLVILSYGLNARGWRRMLGETNRNRLVKEMIETISGSGTQEIQTQYEVY